MANLRFIFRNLADEATVSASPALLTTLPEANLQYQERYKTARTSSLASQELRLSWASAQTIDTACVRLHNLTAAAQIAHPTYSDSAFTTAIDTNAAANCFGYTGFDALDVLTDADFRLLKNSSRDLTSRSTVQSMKFTITDAANPDGYFDVSRLFVGVRKEMAYNPPYGGVPLTFMDASTQGRMDDGSLVSDKRHKARRIELTQEWCSTADWNWLLAGLRRVGRDKDFWMSVFPGDGTYLEAYYQGTFKVVDNGGFDRHLPNLARQRLVLEET